MSASRSGTPLCPACLAQRDLAQNAMKGRVLKTMIISNLKIKRIQQRAQGPSVFDLSVSGRRGASEVAGGRGKTKTNQLPTSPLFPSFKIHHFTPHFHFPTTKTTHSLPPPPPPQNLSSLKPTPQIFLALRAGASGAALRPGPASGRRLRRAPPARPSGPGLRPTPPACASGVRLRRALRAKTQTRSRKTNTHQRRRRRHRQLAITARAESLVVGSTLCRLLRLSWTNSRRASTRLFARTSSRRRSRTCLSS